jgi:hypothetical protein
MLWLCQAHPVLLASVAAMQLHLLLQQLLHSVGVQRTSEWA